MVVEVRVKYLYSAWRTMIMTDHWVLYIRDFKRFLFFLPIPDHIKFSERSSFWPCICPMISSIIFLAVKVSWSGIRFLWLVSVLRSSCQLSLFSCCWSLSSVLSYDILKIFFLLVLLACSNKLLLIDDAELASESSLRDHNKRFIRKESPSQSSPAGH